MIYLIHPDYQHYQSFVFDSKVVRKALGDETQFHFSRAPVSYLDSWHPFEVNFASLGASKKAEIPDIMVRNGRLFLSTKAYDALKTVIKNSGEFLPVTYGEKNGYIFNVLSVAEDVDGIDKKLSTKNEYGEVQSLSFEENKVKSFPLFRTKFDGFMGLYCGEEFKKIIEERKLKGIQLSLDLGNAFASSSTANSPIRN